MDITAIIADDHSMMREGLKSLLEINGITVLASVDNGRDAVEKTLALKPHIVIMDVTMPILNGIQATARIKKALPRVHILALSMHSGKQIMERMLAAGASGYILKECAFNEFHDAIHVVLEGRIYLNEKLLEIIGGIPSREQLLRGKIPGFYDMSTKEIEILQLLAEGWKTRQIAEQVCVSVKTIESHRRNIMKKLNIDTVAGLTRFAIREGIISPE